MIKLESLIKTGSQLFVGFFIKSRQLIEKIGKKLGKKHFIVGIDIGSSSIKIAQFKKVDSDLMLVYSNVVEFSQEAGPDTKLTTLNKALGGIDIKKSEFICVINCPGTFTLELTVPYMSHSELTEAVKWQARKFIPFIAEDTEVDFQIQGEVNEKGTKHLRILVSLSPKKTIAENLSLLNQAGIKPTSLIPAPLALKSLIDRLGAVKDETLAILEIGANITEIVIFKSNMPVFNRKIPVTGMDFTKSFNTKLASERGVLELSLKESEQIKRICGIPKVASQELIDGKISCIQAISLMRPVLERLSNQISQSFDYYHESWSPDKINRLIIYGGGAKLKGLDEFLASELNIKVELGDCVAGVDKLEGALKKEDSLQLDLAIGAALNRSKDINMLPLELKTQTQKSVWGAAFKATVTAVILILAFVYIGMQIQLSNFNKKLTAQDLLLKVLGPQLKEAREQLEINNVINELPFWEDIFRELSNVLPDNLYLTNMVIDSDNMVLKGVILSKEFRMEEVLSQFMLGLENGIFKEVSLVSTQKKQEPFESLEFEIKCKLE